jgi:hypothetical protein
MGGNRLKASESQCGHPQFAEEIPTGAKNPRPPPGSPRTPGAKSLVRLTHWPVAAHDCGRSCWVEFELYSKGRQRTVLGDMRFSLGRPIEGQLMTVLPYGSFWRGLIARARVPSCPPSYFLVFPGLPLHRSPWAHRSHSFLLV